MNNIEIVIEDILSEVRNILIEKLTNSEDFLDEEINTEDLLEESDNVAFANADDFEDSTPIDLSNVLKK